MRALTKKIVITGGEGRFAKTLKKNNKNLNIFFPNKKELNILSIKSIEKYLKKIKPKYILHAAGLSRPMNIHDKNIEESIENQISSKIYQRLTAARKVVVSLSCFALLKKHFFFFF